MNSQIWTYGGAVLSFGNLTLLSWQIFTGRITPISPASWMMWLIIDLVLLGSTVAAGQSTESILLVCSYTGGAAICFGVHLIVSRWKWTMKETWSALGATLACVLWITLSPRAGVVASVGALIISTIPIAIDLWKRPSHQLVLFFVTMTVACGATLVGSYPFTLTGSLFPAVCTLSNAVLTYLTSRPHKH